MADDLKRLLGRARKADGLNRIELRDPIAKHGKAAVEAIAPWLADPTLGAFAVRVLDRAAHNGAKREAIAALSAARTTAPTEAIRRDIDSALDHLHPRPARPPGDAFGVEAIPATAGLEWPGFRPEEFRTLTGTSWRSRDGRTSLAPIIATALRYAHPHFESYSVERSPELHFAVRERYRQGGEAQQGWRAGKLVVYAHGPRTDDPAERPEQVTAGLYLEKGDGGLGFGPVDDGWDWPWFLRALETEHFRGELARVMVAHDLSIGDYARWRHGTEAENGVGFIGRFVEGELAIDDVDGGRAYGFDELLDRLEALPADHWADLHLWRSWPAPEAIAAGRSFAFDELIPLLTALTGVYLDIVSEPLAKVASQT